MNYGNEKNDYIHQKQVDLAMQNMPEKIEQLTRIEQKKRTPTIRRNILEERKNFKVNYVVDMLSDEVNAFRTFLKLLERF